MTDLRVTKLAAASGLIAAINTVVQRGSLDCDTQAVEKAVDAIARHALANAQNHYAHIVSDVDVDHGA